MRMMSSDIYPTTEQPPDWVYTPAQFPDFSAPYELNNTYPPYNVGIIDLTGDDSSSITSRKRSRRERSEEDERPVSKLSRPSDPEYVQDLEAQIRELHEFIISQNLLSSQSAHPSPLVSHDTALTHPYNRSAAVDPEAP